MTAGEGIAAQRDFLTAVLDTLVPPSGEFPGAGAVALDHGLARADEVLRMAGAHAVDATPLLRTGGWHLMGTARMGADPRRSVVDPHGRCHEVPNLYIVDGSILVTGGAVNPTSTIQALALRVADSIKRNARDL